MEENDALMPYLASLVEVSIVEDSSSTLTFSEFGVAAQQDSKSSLKANSSYVGKQDESQDFASHEVLILESQPETDFCEEEKQYFDLVFNDLKKVMYMRLHCTVCGCHIGCAPTAAFIMASHKFLHVLICIDCEAFYENGGFPCDEDGSETFCCWCGQGGQLFCCSLCPSVFCKKCIRRNLGQKTVQMIQKCSDWTCFRCYVRPIWEHRALCWGLSKFLKEQSKAENTIPADVAEKCPGFNLSLCCQGEKHGHLRAHQPLRSIVPPVARDTLKVKNMRTLMSPSSEMNILRNTLILGRQALDTTSSSITKMSLNTDCGEADLNIPASSTFSPLQSVSVVTRQSPNGEDSYVKSPNTHCVSDSSVKIYDYETPFKPGVSTADSVLLACLKQPLLTFESSFFNYIGQSSIQNQTLHKDQSFHQRSAVPVTGCVTDNNPSDNLRASAPLTYVQVPECKVMPPRSNSSAGPTVNKVCMNKYNNFPPTLPASNMSNARRIQRRTVTPVPTCYIVSRNPHEVPKVVPSFHNPQFPSSGHIEQTSPPYQDTICLENVENVVTKNDVHIKDISLDDDNDIVEVCSNVEDSNDSLKIGCEWMMKVLRKTDRTSRILAYHVDFLKQKFVSEMEGKDASLKGLRQFAGKFHHLLVKASKRLNLEKEFLIKKFSDWLNAERAKHEITATKETGPNSDAETSQEPVVLLDMEISYESDHEDVSSLNSGVKQELIECSETLSENGSDSEDPFSDSEGTERGQLNPLLKPLFSCTVRELMKDKFSRKLLLQLLTEHHSETANTQKRCAFSAKGLSFTNVATQTDAHRGEKVVAEEEESTSTQNKEVSSTKEIRFVDVPIQACAPSRDVFTVTDKESKITQNKSVSTTEEIHFIDVSTQTDTPTVEEKKSKTSKLKQVRTVKMSDQISSKVSDLSLHSDEFSADSGKKNEKRAKTKAVKKSQMDSFHDRLEDKTGNEESENGQNPGKNNSAGNAQIPEVVTETNSILMNGDTAPIQSGSESERSRKSLAMKRKYKCAESYSDTSTGMQTYHSNPLKVVAKKLRPNNQTSHFSSSPVMIPEGTKVDGKIPVAKFTALASSALQKILLLNLRL
ncbi:uncharacterized protein LOC110834394 isoform X2 [Zootermopsis nevadensis]|uniref:Transcriptional regulator ATRX n=1 Tax=Zootermopsis nevadensis TaxID=136037 RepID=A0A067QWM3_ZOONE|nr:uncharacterized protein LOC110834394 isoform X2 [Zootermopsis nevadensis]KDR14567.1 Transcriptional regulator ATRX [Zootermopsis nevadensis]